MNDKEKYLHEIIDDIEEFINDAKPARLIRKGYGG